VNEFENDARAAALARRLASADFSLESGVRHSLRARLLGHSAPPAATPARMWVAWALAALALWIPIRSALRPEPRFPVGEHGLPVLPGRLETARFGRPEPVFEARPSAPVFEAVPAAAIFEGRPFVSVFETRPTSLAEIFVKVTQ